MSDAITVGDGNSPAPKGHDEEMVKKFEDASAPEVKPEVKPEGDAGAMPELPEKFKTWEDFVASHSELESKLGSNNESEGEPSGEADEKAEGEPSGEAFSLSPFQDEYAQDGELSLESYKVLEDNGYSKELVDDYISGQESKMNAIANEAYTLAGGEEAFESMLDWAGDTFSDAEADAFDAAIEGDTATRNMAIANLKAKYIEANGSEPNLQNGNGTDNTGGGYETWAQVTAAMKDPLYASDKAYRDKVDAKLSLSEL